MPVQPVSNEQDASSSVAGPSSTKSEFERVFRPFMVKKDAELAPINRFRCPQKRDTRHYHQTNRDVIVIDDEDEDEDEVKDAQDVEMRDVQREIDLGQMSGQGRSHCVPLT